MRIKYASKFVFYDVAVICTITKEQRTDAGLCEPL